MTRPRGAKPAHRHQLAAARPHVIAGTTPQQFLRLPTQLSYWLNDVDGDCVTAEEAFKCACHQPEILIADSEVQAWATARGFMNGAYLTDVMFAMQTQGFSQGGYTYDDGPYTSVDWTNPLILQNAIVQGPVKIGIAATQLENVVPDPPRNGWFATGFTKDSTEDHCVSLCGYGPAAWLAQCLGNVIVPNTINKAAIAYALFTWKSVGIIDFQSIQAITGEAWLRTPSTVIH